MKANDVLSGERRWAVEQGDAIEFLRSLPDDSVDLLFTSPPYELARTYGIGEKMVGGEAWVKWMVELVTAASPKVKGLVAINCEGQTRGYRYSCAPFLLVADLHRAGFNCRKPPIFRRVGIPGGGGPDWLRNDYEPIVCVTRKGKLPWSDNTACGHTPKYGVGGDPSHRASNGNRVSITVCRRGTASGGGQQTRESQSFSQPAIANPGNASLQHTYTAEEVAVMLAAESDWLALQVGGGMMGHAIAHSNEAPFPLALPAFFVKSFCPPDGIVCDPFSGSGTTLHACLDHGRRFVGCDIRESQVDLACRRAETVTPTLFAGLSDTTTEDET